MERGEELETKKETIDGYLFNYLVIRFFILFGRMTYGFNLSYI